MQRPKIRYAIVVTEMGLYMAQSAVDPLSLKMGDRTDFTIVSVIRPLSRTSL